MTIPTPASAPKSNPLPRRRRFWSWLLLTLLVVLFGVMAFFAFTPEAPDPFINLAYLTKDHPVKRMTNVQFETQIAHDMPELASCRDGLTRINQQLDSLAKELPTDAGKLFPEQRRQLKMLWMGFIDHQIALFQLKDIYKVFPGISRFSAPGDRWRHARTFTVAYFIHLLQIDASWKFITTFNGRTDYESILDERDREFGIPPGAYAKMKFQVLHLRTLAGIQAVNLHFVSLNRNHYGQFSAQCPEAPDRWISGAVIETFPRVIVRYHTEGAPQFTQNVEDLAKEGLFKSWFPIQKEVSEWMGDTSVATRKSLISLEQIETMQKALQPGDIILERRNWYLSNIGLPGFWPHAALYIGTLEEMEQSLGADPGVKAYLAAQGAASIEALLEKRHPKLLAAYRLPKQHHPVRVIESISEGVSLSSLEHSCLADYVCALRPRVTALDRLKAILAAFSHWTKPYDFDFDFITDDKIVCSELVYKSWRPDTDKPGVSLELKEVMGRKVLPSNEFIGLYRTEFGQPARQLDFVYFLEGNEGDGKAHVSTAEKLADSFTRPKWDLLQE